MSDDPNIVTLVDGYKAETNGTTTTYKTVVLREANYDDETAARRAAERPVQTAQGWRLLESQVAYDNAMLQRQIVELQAPGAPSLPGISVDLGKFSGLDVAKIHQRIQRIELAASVRHGLLSQEDFDAFVSGQGAEAPAGGRGLEPGEATPGSQVLDESHGDDA